MVWNKFNGDINVLIEVCIGRVMGEIFCGSYRRDYKKRFSEVGFWI